MWHILYIHHAVLTISDLHQSQQDVWTAWTFHAHLNKRSTINPSTSHHTNHLRITWANHNIDQCPQSEIGGHVWKWCNDMGVSKNRGIYPQIIHFNRVFHYFHHPFWWVSPLFSYFWKHPYVPTFHTISQQNVVLPNPGHLSQSGGIFSSSCKFCRPNDYGRGQRGRSPDRNMDKGLKSIDDWYIHDVYNDI